MAKVPLKLTSRAVDPDCNGSVECRATKGGFKLEIVAWEQRDGKNFYKRGLVLLSAAEASDLAKGIIGALFHSHQQLEKAAPPETK
jgi:hypothetical protein